MLEEALSVANNADVVVAVLGEASEMSGEAASRSDINLPESQVKLLHALYATGKPVVVVLMSGRPLVLTDVLPYCSAILECWFPGTQAGPAIVNTLYGKNNPSGKITMTFPQNEGQIPIYYNSRTTGRPFDNNQKYTSKYLDVSNEPLFPFGFGLSYSNFEYSNLTAETKGTSVVLTAEIKNISQIDGQEVVQFYASDLEATYTRPKKQLVGFEKVTLKAGESKKVTVNVEQSQLGYYDQKGEWFFEPGMFRFSVGGSSQTNLNKELKVLKTFKPIITPEF
jgi:beta-glucosidase